jgi:protein SCO1/2
MKTISLLLFLAACGAIRAAEAPAATAPAAAEKADACCCQKDEPSTAPDAVRRDSADAAAAFSQNSIYQVDARFTDDAGRPFALASLRGRPVVIDLFFASCGSACPLAVTDMVALQKRLPAELRERAAFVLVSFDGDRDTSAALAQYRAQRHLGEQWILLRGEDESVRELAAVLGVQYRKTADGGFTHSNQLAVLNPEGEIVHERKGLTGGLEETAVALAQAGK